MRDFSYVCNMKYIDEKFVEQIVNECFGVDFKNPPKDITIEVKDLIDYTDFVINTLMKSSIKETRKMVINEVANATKINYN